MSRHPTFADKPAHQHNESPGDALAPQQSATTDAEKASNRYADSETGVDFRHENAVAIRKLLLKLDVGIMPFAVLLYLGAYLDRGNMGNARLVGLQKTVLDDSDTKYSIALCCFFITYIVLSVPGTLLARHFNPSRTIACGALIWSIAASAQAGTQNPAGVYVCRLFIGIGEAMFGQAMAFYLSLFYTRFDLAKRIGFFISAGSLAGAFGGLIAFGVAKIKHPSIPQWRALFLIEGIPVLVLAICVALFMPSRPDKTRYLNENERTLCITRLNAESSFEDADTGIDWAGVRRSLTDWKTYVVSVMYSCLNLGLASVGGFLPTIVKGLGYSNADAQLYTVPPYAVALVFMLLMATISDRTQARGIPIMITFCVQIVGWSLLLAIPAAHNTHAQLRARYFGCICVATAGYTNIPIIMAWQSGNTGNQSQRATSLGMLNSLGQCLSLAASFLFPSPEGPQFTKGCTVNVAFACLGLVIASSMTIYYRLENKRRDRVEGTTRPAAMETHTKFDLAPGFRYVT